MSIIQYSEFIGVTVLAIILVMRGCYFLFVAKADPIKSLLPSLAWWYMNHEKSKQASKTMRDNS